MTNQMHPADCMCGRCETVLERYIPGAWVQLTPEEQAAAFASMEKTPPVMHPTADELSFQMAHDEAQTAEEKRIAYARRKGAV